MTKQSNLKFASNAAPIPQHEQHESKNTHYVQMAVKNYKPREPKEIPKPSTRFRKRGPMSQVDWKEFIKWAKTRTQPKKNFQQPPAVQRKKAPLEALKPRIQSLSKPKHPRSKFSRPDVVHPHSPKIFYHKPPRRNARRPFQPIILPKWWLHDEHEMAFWRSLRFPVSRRARKFKDTLNVRKMAVPRKYPIKEHCTWAEREYVMPDRVRMSPAQWKHHLQHLKYLADGSFKETRHLKVKF